MHLEGTALERLEALTREAASLVGALVAEQCAVLRQADTEGMLDLVADRFTIAETRLQVLEDRMNQIADLEDQIAQLAEGTPVGQDKRAASLWTRFLHLFQGAGNGQSQE